MSAHQSAKLRRPRLIQWYLLRWFLLMDILWPQRRAAGEAEDQVAGRLWAASCSPPVPGIHVLKPAVLSITQCWGVTHGSASRKEEDEAVALKIPGKKSTNPTSNYPIREEKSGNQKLGPAPWSRFQKSVLRLLQCNVDFFFLLRYYSFFQINYLL